MLSNGEKGDSTAYVKVLNVKQQQEMKKKTRKSQIKTFKTISKDRQFVTCGLHSSQIKKKNYVHR